MKRRLISLLLVLAVLLAFAPGNVIGPGGVNAAEPDKLVTDEGFVYQDNGDGTATITDYDGTATDITVPNEINGLKVTTIGRSAFENKDLTKVVIQDGISIVGVGAFQNNKNLTEVKIPESVTEIGGVAFQFTGLKEIYVPSKVSNVQYVRPTYAVKAVVSSDNPYFTAVDGIVYSKDMKKLVICPGKKSGEVVVPDGVTEIGDKAFAGVLSLNGIILPDSVTEIGNSSFWIVGGNQSFRIPESVEIIGEGNFSTKGLVIGKKGSRAEAYALEKGCAFMEEKCDFEDVSLNNFYYNAVVWACQTEPAVTSGVDSTHFKPLSTCNRAQMITFLWKKAGCPEPVNNENPFTDIDEDTFYYKAVLWGKERNIVAGKTEDKFAPLDPCTRGQYVLFLWRMNGYPRAYIDTCPFSDVDMNTDLGKAVLWATSTRITQGITDTRFGTKRVINRAQAVTFLMRNTSWGN
ncbi:MAG: leucine-rich repeat protein [Eubacterium sp.]|nr:leucine-rich repeat protein [Eubacterium sp.]